MEDEPTWPPEYLEKKTVKRGKIPDAELTTGVQVIWTSFVIG